MNIAIISGSHRVNSQSAKMMKAVQHRLLNLDRSLKVYCFDLAEQNLPLWDVELHDELSAEINHMGTILENCHAFVVIAPEWHGMVPAALKNFFLHFSAQQLAHKPALIVSVSAGDGGAYPVAELRMSSYKNSRICYLPEHLIVRHVEQVFNQDGKNDQHAQSYLENRLHYCLTMLNEYALALANVRKNLLKTKGYPNGM